MKECKFKVGDPVGPAPGHERSFWNRTPPFVVYKVRRSYGDDHWFVYFTDGDNKLRGLYEYRFVSIGGPW